jgi:3-oxoacyl-[acyl-carrier-protein] synthase-3
MTRYYSKITGWGMYVPKNVLTNADLEKMLDTNDEWIVSRTGIRERRIISEGETTVSMSLEASKHALEKAGIAAADLDLIILASSTPDYLVPPASSIIQDQLGATKAAAMTLVAGCSGFVYSLNTASQFIQTGAYEHILVIGAETLSVGIDWEDRGTAILFGDGAGAVIVSRTSQPGGLLSISMGSDGSGWDALIVPALGTKNYPSHENIDNKEHRLKMKGRPVFKFATRVMSDVAVDVVTKAGMTMDDVDVLIPHQANQRIIDLALRRLNFPAEKTIVNLDRYGNTSAASVPLALVEALEDGRIQDNDKVVMIAFGAGLTYAAAVWQFQPMEVSPEDEAILVTNWPVDNAFQRKMQEMRTAAFKMKVQARTKASEASMAIMLPLYSFRKGLKKRMKNDDNEPKALEDKQGK